MVGKRQINRYATRPCHRSPKATGPRQGAMRWVRDRDMDRHTIQSEVGYLFSVLWRGRGEGRRKGTWKEPERERTQGGGAMTAANSLGERWKGKDSGWKLKISLPQQTGACLLKGQIRSLQFHLFLVIKGERLGTKS